MYSIHATQKIPVNLQQAWAFFSNPGNLFKITPASMKFTVLTKDMGEKIYSGQILEYIVKPLLNIPFHWITEITKVAEPQFFIDEQRKGPYSLWRHQHFFKAIDGGVEMNDIVHYNLPLWILGDMMNVLIVKNKLADLFHYRYQQTEKLLGKWEGQQPRITFGTG